MCAAVVAAVPLLVRLTLSPQFRNNPNIQLHVNTMVTSVNPKSITVKDAKTGEIRYDCPWSWLLLVLVLGF